MQIAMKKNNNTILWMLSTVAYLQSGQSSSSFCMPKCHSLLVTSNGIVNRLLQMLQRKRIPLEIVLVIPCQPCSRRSIDRLLQG
jgi:hypothetical protein